LTKSSSQLGGAFLRHSVVVTHINKNFTEFLFGYKPTTTTTTTSTMATTTTTIVTTTERVTVVCELIRLISGF